MNKQTASRHLHLATLDTPLGPMLLAATSAALCMAEFGAREELAGSLEKLRRALGMVAPDAPGNAITERAAEQLSGYFAGPRQTFSIPLLTAGTPFQEQVWAELRRIPYGVTRSYGEQARRIGRPRAVRAVARANGANRLAVIIPCHRVIGANGKLTGYASGLWRKEWLLAREGIALAGGSRREPAAVHSAL